MPLSAPSLAHRKDCVLDSGRDTGQGQNRACRADNADKRHSRKSTKMANDFNRALTAPRIRNADHGDADRGLQARDLVDFRHRAGE